MIPIIPIDRNSQVPLHEQIVEGFDSLIQAGWLKPGDPMPSSRELAEGLAVARGTVVRAYRQLVERGLVVARAGQGAEVARKKLRFNNSDSSSCEYQR